MTDAPTMTMPSTQTEKSTQRPVLVNLGCGPVATPSAWIDCDGSWQAKIIHWPKPVAKFARWMYRSMVSNPLLWPNHVKYVDLRRRLPFADNSVDAVYASHVLEHLYHAEAEALIRECVRILRPGGRLRLAVPNLRYLCERYLSSDSPTAGDELQKSLMFREERPTTKLLTRFYHLCGGDFHSHKWMYDSASMCHLFEKCGLVDAAPRDCHVTEIPEIQAVEGVNRVSATAGFAVEGVKP